MRTGLKYMTPVCAAGAAAVAIAAAPVAMADPAPAQPATIATAPAAVAPNIVQIAGHGGGGFHGGRWGGDRGGWPSERGRGNLFCWRRERALDPRRQAALADTPSRKRRISHPRHAPA